MTDSRPVYTLFKGTAEENPMRLSVDDVARMIALTEDRGSELGCAVILMTPHRAKAIGERLIEMAAGLVQIEPQ